MSHVIVNCMDLGDPEWCGALAFGNYVAVEHTDGTRAWYMHMQKDSAVVAIGDVVLRGDQLGNLGNTGRSTGPHVHFQVTPRGNDGSTTRAAYEVMGSAGAETCVIPETGGEYESSNAS